MRYSRGTKKLLIFYAIIIIAALVFYTILFISIREKTIAVSLLSNEIDVVMQREAKLSSIKALVKDTDTERRMLNLYIVGSDEEIGLIEMIEALGNDTGAAIEIISVGIEPLLSNSIESDTAELLRLNFTASGSWKSVFHMLALIESIPFNVTVTQVNLEREADHDKNKSNSWTGSFSIAVVKHK
jgi:hypothetical protein